MVQPNPNEIAHPPACDITPRTIPADPEIAAAETLNRTLPEIEEFADISTRVVDTGAVRIAKHVDETERTFQPTLHEQHIHVDRIPVNRVVRNAPQVRTEGDTTIIPVIEEVIVKLILIKEEIRVTRHTIEKIAEPQHVTLRREHIDVQRIPAASPTQTNMTNEEH